MKVADSEETVVEVFTNTVKDATSTIMTSEWVVDHSVPSLEPDLGLEGVLTNRTYHLEGNVWTVEQTSVIWAYTFITDTTEIRASCA